MPSSVEKQSQGTDWEQAFKRVAAALTLVGVGYSACWFQTKEILLPSQQGRLGYEIEQARAKIASLTEALDKTKVDADERIRRAEQRIKDLEHDVKLKKAQVRDAQLASLFLFGTPYPVGLASVRVGDLRDEVERVYPTERLKKTEDGPGGYWSVNADHEIFPHVTYYFVKQKNSLSVGQVAFYQRYDGKLKSGDLERKLTELLGVATKTNRRGHKYWDVPGKLRVYWMGDTSYNVSAQGYIPGSWRD